MSNYSFLENDKEFADFVEELNRSRDVCALLAEAWCIYGVYRGFTSVEKTLIDWSESESAARANLDTRLKYNLHKDQYQELVLEKKRAVKDGDGNLTFC